MKGLLPRLILLIVIVPGLNSLLQLGISSNQSAFAAIAPDGSNWGAATQDAAPLGDHASDQNAGGDIDSAGGRTGLGNLAQLFGSWCGLLDFLHQFDPDSFVCS